MKTQKDVVVERIPGMPKQKIAIFFRQFTVLNDFFNPKYIRRVLAYRPEGSFLYHKRYEYCRHDNSIPVMEKIMFLNSDGEIVGREGKRWRRWLYLFGPYVKKVRNSVRWRESVGDALYRLGDKAKDIAIIVSYLPRKDSLIVYKIPNADYITKLFADIEAAEKAEEEAIRKEILSEC